jgi:prophage antirepressor-like protein
MTTQIASDFAHSIFDMVNNSIIYENSTIKTFGTYEDPWFCGKDIAKILGYERPTTALSDNLEKDDKQPLLNLIQKVSVSAVYPKYNKNDLKTIYINESGLYSLIISSKLPEAKKFKQWITKEVLPNIRKMGQEKYLKELEMMKEEKENQCIELEESRKKLIDSERKFEHHKRGMEQIKQFINNSKERQTNQRIYIAFCPTDAYKNLFKVGGCSSQTLLKTRLAVYNSGQSEDNRYSFAAIWNCNNFQHAEARIKQVIGEFRQTSNKELYMMHYICLSKIIDFVINHYNEENEEINIFIRDIVRTMTELDPVIPQPLTLNGIEILQIHDGEEVKRDVFDTSMFTDDEKQNFVASCMKEYIKAKHSTNDEMIQLAWTTFRVFFIEQMKIPTYKFRLCKWKDYLKKETEREILGKKISIKWK